MAQRSPPFRDDQAAGIVQEAARILCEEGQLDYRTAKLKAVQRLGLSPRAALPDNARIQSAVVEYQRLFGGLDYARRLRRMRAAAVKAMRLLEGFEPRLVGAVVNGAVTAAHRVQLQAFDEQAERVELFLHDRGIPFRQDDRTYRYPDGSEERVPLVRFDAGDIGIDVAVFAFDDRRRVPLSPMDGLPMKRLALAEAEALARIGEQQILAGP
ncbi:MAG: hypothetical protein ISP90_04150 [Nevskia sp.]|nr:hypothetical protein [Nevskia sp.]